ncbi:Na+/H+ antiporter [Brevibacterium sp. BRM-1]|uniref:Na+/H+ antiporter n=1 Tax=Brevibacterium sp. BRM-1 TaxID=2999062 RepID=UPI00228241F5|nr:Na+/H+ antiporter [Brevibacterium sp. BRM-1]WAL39693.1 Na+/H+ antiporter [Brevibacterium sp. BRM-1]
MHTVLLLVCLAVAVLAGTALSERLRLPAPMVLIVIGVVGSFLPFVPTITLSPDIVLYGLLPPLLYSAALQTSIVDIRANITSVASLSVALIVVTTVTVGAAVHFLAPDIPWSVALALGAVVAPPDAVSASAVARRIGLPRHIVTVLEGESLLNDATALVALRAAVAAIAGSVAAGEIALEFLIAAGGGIVVGLVLATIVIKVRPLIRDPLVDMGISFVVPFAAYLAAEAVEASGVIAVVVAGLLIGHKAPIVQTTGSRITERITWATTAFLLEHAVFLLIGLQAASILMGSEDGMSPLAVAGLCAAVLATVIVTRLVWLCATHALRNLRTSRDQRPPWSSALVIGWAGMRGVVTIAAVFVIPQDVPHHDVLVLAALTVVLGTLYIQGLTLPLVTRILRVSAADPAAEALARASLLQKAGEAGLAELSECEDRDPHGVSQLIRERVEERSFAAWERLSTTPGQETPSDAYARIRRRMIAAERARVLAIRRKGKFPSHIVQEVLTTLDYEESMLEPENEAREPIVATGSGQGGYCDDLAAFASTTAPEGASCRLCDEAGIHPVALRMCLECGEVACCDSSPGRHATAHFHHTGHPVMQSAEPGETWRWCYVHRLAA